MKCKILIVEIDKKNIYDNRIAEELPKNLTKSLLYIEEHIKRLFQDNPDIIPLFQNGLIIEVNDHHYCPAGVQSINSGILMKNLTCTFICKMQWYNNENDIDKTNLK